MDIAAVSYGNSNANPEKGGDASSRYLWNIRRETCNNLWHRKQTAHARNEGQSFERLAHIHIIIRDTARVLSNSSQTVSQNPAWLNPHPQDVRSHLMQWKLRKLWLYDLMQAGQLELSV